MLKTIYHRYLKPFERKLDTLNRIEISSEAILHNFDYYQKLNPGQTIFPVLKANAYGHGLTQVAQILQARKPEYLLVDSYYEALNLNTTGDFKVLLIGYTKPQNYRYFSFKNTAVTVYDQETIKALGQSKRQVKIHVKVDTGMRRQGIMLLELNKHLAEIQKYPNLEFEGLLSHLADADNQDEAFSKKQKALFLESLDLVKKAGFKPKYVHLGNSAGSLKFHHKEFNSIRLGLGLYGYHTLTKTDQYYKIMQKLQPSLKFISTVVCTKKLTEGDKVSYNGTFEVQHDMSLGVVPVGYYEGVDRNLSNRGFFLSGNKKLPILGRVCMNLTSFDITDTNLKLGDEVIIISNQKNDPNSVMNIAAQCDTIPYVVTTKLSESIRRIVV